MDAEYLFFIHLLIIYLLIYCLLIYSFIIYLFSHLLFTYLFIHLLIVIFFSLYKKKDSVLIKVFLEFVYTTTAHAAQRTAIFNIPTDNSIIFHDWYTIFIFFYINVFSITRLILI